MIRPISQEGKNVSLHHIEKERLVDSRLVDSEGNQGNENKNKFQGKSTQQRRIKESFERIKSRMGLEMERK